MTDVARTSVEAQELWDRFHQVVNMTSEELTAWLGTEPDLDAPHPGEDAPPPLGSGVTAILAKRRSDLTNDDLTVMQKVIEVVEDETDAATKGELVNDERRRHRLMSVGHDPFREP